MRYSFIVIILSILVLSCEDVASNNGVKKDLQDNPYADLRKQALIVQAEDLNLQLENGDLYGMVMDWNIGDAVVTVVSYKTGDASIYISTGQMMIGGIKHKTITQAAKEFVTTGNQFISISTKTDDFTLPGNGLVNFYFLQKGAITFVDAKYSELENNSNLSSLFNKANQIITEYRLITE